MQDVTAKLQRELFSFPGFSANNRIVKNSREMADFTAKLKCDVFSFPGFSAKQFWCTECN